jgi:transcriptional antiterminator RfaH
MPILPAEPDLYPEALFAEGTEAAVGRSWWVLHTKPRQEKSLARHLLALATPYYLPSAVRRTRVRGRLLTSHVPLFPGYLFLLGDSEDRVAALTSNRVVRSLPVAAQERLWGDLRQIYRLLGSGVPVTPEERLVPGAPVEIATGPLAGLRGVIERTATGRRFIVQVDFIQRGASVTLDDTALVPLTQYDAPAACRGRA